MMMMMMMMQSRAAPVGVDRFMVSCGFQVGVLSLLLMLMKVDQRAREGVCGMDLASVMQEPIDGCGGCANHEQGHQHDGQSPHTTT